MKELLRYICIKPKEPVDRARSKAQQELRNLQLNPRKLRDYWYHYEALAGDIQSHVINEDNIRGALTIHHARPRRGLTVQNITQVFQGPVHLDATKIELPQTSQNLQQVVKFSRKGLRAFPGTTK